jgi:hypothetical protein
MQDSDIWEEYNTTLKASELNKSLNINFDTCNFLSAIRKEDDEVIFSNLFAYYFTNFKEFTIKFYDKYGISLNKNYKVSREKNRTDIEIEDERNLIIIENKIKSGIMKYKKSEKDSNNIEFETQLEKNYKVANERELEDKSNRGIKCFIFLPDYSLIKEEDCKFHYSNEEIVYTQVRYSEIYKLFEANRIEDKYYDDFMKALSKHSSVYDNNMFEEMQRRFFKKIQETKEQQ